MYKKLTLGLTLFDAISCSLREVRLPRPHAAPGATAAGSTGEKPRLPPEERAHRIGDKKDKKKAAHLVK